MYSKDKKIIIIISIVLMLLLPLTMDYKLSLIGIFILISIISIMKPIVWIYIMLFYITFEVPILNFVPAGIIPYMRYGIEFFNYVILIKSIFSYTKKSEQFKITKTDKFIFSFIIISIIGALINLVDFTIYLMGIRWLIRYVVIYYIFRLNSFKNHQIERLLKCFYYLIIIQVILGLMQFVFRERLDMILKPKEIDIGFYEISMSQLESKFGIYSTFGRYGQFSYFISVAIAFIFAYYRKTKKRKYLVLFLVTCLVLLLTYARQAVLGVAIALLIYIFMDKYEGRISKKKIVGLIAVLLFSLVIYLGYGNFVLGKGILNESISQRYLSIFSLDFVKFDYNGRGRTYFLTTVNKKFLENKPLLGYGTGMYGTESAISYDKKVYNKLEIPTQFSMDVYWTSVLGQVGLIGLILLFMIYYSFYSKSKIYIKNDGLLGIMSVTIKILFIMIMIESFFGSNLSDRYQAFYIWMFFGIFDNLKLNYKNNSDF